MWSKVPRQRSKWELRLSCGKKSPSDVVADTQETPETVADEPAVEQVTPELVLRRSSSTIRVQDMYVRSLPYLLLMKGNQSPLIRPYSWRIQPSWEQAMNDEMSRLQK